VHGHICGSGAREGGRGKGRRNGEGKSEGEDEEEGGEGEKGENKRLMRSQEVIQDGLYSNMYIKGHVR